MNRITNGISHLCFQVGLGLVLCYYMPFNRAALASALISLGIYLKKYK